MVSSLTIPSSLSLGNSGTLTVSIPCHLVYCLHSMSPLLYCLHSMSPLLYCLHSMSPLLYYLHSMSPLLYCLHSISPLLYYLQSQVQTYTYTLHVSARQFTAALSINVIHVSLSCFKECQCMTIVLCAFTSRISSLPASLSQILTRSISLPGSFKGILEQVATSASPTKTSPWQRPLTPTLCRRRSCSVLLVLTTTGCDFLSPLWAPIVRTMQSLRPPPQPPTTSSGLCS